MVQIVVSLRPNKEKAAKIKILNDWLTRWNLSPSQGAKVLKIQKSKMSEYLNEKSERLLPNYIESHIETFNFLSPKIARQLIEERLKKCLPKLPLVTNMDV